MTRVAVVALGKIGLPLAALFAARGVRVTGCDIDPRVVEAVNAGISPVGGEPGLTEAIARAHDAGLLSATTDTAAAVSESGVTVVVVRTELDESLHADFTALDAATDAIAEGLRPGVLVVLETTVPVGVTRNRFARRLQEHSGLDAGAFQVAYSPERVSSGSVFRDLATYPKLVGGVDTASGEAAAAFYRSVLDAEVLLLPDAETAEFAKLAESVYRDVNIALANELAIAAEALGVDYAAAARAGNSQPYSHLHAPGVGVGGHCIPVYPYFLQQDAGEHLVALGRRVNDSMAAYAAQRLAGAFEGGLAGKWVLVLGLAYRGGVKEAAFSSTHLLAAELRAAGARVLVHDPLFSDAEIAAWGLEPSRIPPSRRVDAAVLQALHAEYEDLDFATALAGCRVLLDGRRALNRERVEAAGMRYLAIGLPER
jgi:nucleotide sugar dehydrogenase